MLKKYAMIFIIFIKNIYITILQFLFKNFLKMHYFLYNCQKKKKLFNREIWSRRTKRTILLNWQSKNCVLF